MRALAGALLLLGCWGRAFASDFKIERLSAGTLGLSASAAAGPIEVVAEQVLVQFSSAASSTDKDNALLALGGVAQQDAAVPGWVLVTLSSGSSVVPYLSRLNGFHGVVQVVPNRVLHFNAYPSDPGVPSQYSLTNTDAFAGWDYDTGSTNKTTVVVIDSGIDFTNQPDLTAKSLNDGTINVSFNSTTGAGPTADNPPTPACSHATEVASVAAASTNNGAGIAGVSWGAQLASVRVFSAGCAGTSDNALAAAVNYVANTLSGKAALGKIVVNMSIGANCSCSSGGCTPLTSAALANLISKNIAIAISAGNYNGISEFCNGAGTSGVDAPANCAGVSAAAGIIPVGATDASNNVASFSCQGAELAAHGVSAPGSNVLVDGQGGGTTTDSGTSFSSPFVAGMMALMLSAKPTLTPAQLEANLRGGANSIGAQSLGAQSGSGSGAGQVNVMRSMRLAVNGTLAGFDGDQKAIAFPNPFRIAQTTIVSFAVPTSLQSTNTEVKIYTANGQLVRDLKTLVWDGKNDAGQLVASGTYLFEVKTDAGKTTGRMAVIR